MALLTAPPRRRLRPAIVSAALAATVWACAASAQPGRPGAPPSSEATRAASVSTPGAPSPAPSRRASRSPSPSASANRSLSLVVLGDSIPIKAMGCASRCEGFDEQYAAELERRLGADVTVRNLARGNARIATLLEALAEPAIADAVAGADVVIVSIGYNDEPPRTEADAPCRVDEPSPEHEIRDFIASAVGFTDACIEATMDWYAPSLQAVYERIERLAAGRSQIRMTLGVFNNWIDHPAVTIAGLPEEDVQAAYRRSIRMKDVWNARDCDLASAHGFVCIDMYHAFNGPDGTKAIEPYVVGDYVHLAAEGHDRIADLLSEVDLSTLD